ncbi:MAG: 23S rRNA (pseudouridine(1915)-N(3))-methyltransferase RlmH, partial [Oscillospiraceae bacterium]|nr:23S rRNA (pseudouridine(1915)-N(3))-methyltransferase RlmH [Oscillospiraceae bacterium]
MRSVTVLAMGKLKEKFYLDAVREYEKRLSGYCRFSLT